MLTYCVIYQCVSSNSFHILHINIDMIRGPTDKKLTSTLVIWTFLRFELAVIFLKYWSRSFFKKAKKTPIFIVIANEDANTIP